MSKNKKIFYYSLMVFLLFSWGLEYIIAKKAIELISPLSLVFIKYTIGLIPLFIMKFISKEKFNIKKKTIITIILAALFGDVLYFFGEFNALYTLNISTVTILLTLVPVVSMLIELVIYKKMPSIVMVITSLLCVVGMYFVTGDDLNKLFNGEGIGFLFVLIAILSWNIYNFATDNLVDEYKPLSLTILQCISSVLLVAPFFISDITNIMVFEDPYVIVGVLYLGLISAGFGFLIYVSAIDILGATSASMFSNFIPVTSSFFGLVLLGEKLSLVQIVAGIGVIICGLFFIRSKNKLDKKLQN